MLRSEWWAQGVDERAPLLLVQTFRSATGLSFWPVVFRLLGQALVRKPVPEGPRVYEPDRSPRAPGRFRLNHLEDFCLADGCARAHPWV